MIIGAHAVLYAHDAEAARAFFRDVLGFASVDAGGGWLIFALPPSEIAIHPAKPADSGTASIYFMCDDIERTVADLKAKGVTFTSEVQNLGWGSLTTLSVPGAGDIGLYQPHHPLAPR